MWFRERIWFFRPSQDNGFAPFSVVLQELKCSHTRSLI